MPLATQNNLWQKNLWGKSLDPQRTDLWRLDMSSVISSLRERRALQWSGIDVEHYAQSVSLPESSISAEVTKRDSIPYNMPSFDDPTGAVTITFILDISAGGSPEILKILEAWRMVTRAGRGQVGGEDAITLDTNYRIDYAFNITVELLGGNPAPQSPGTYFGRAAEPGLVQSAYFVIEQAWLSKLKISDFQYEGKTIATVTATLYADAVNELSASQQISQGRGRSTGPYFGR